MQDSEIRSPHANLDSSARAGKARKILHLLEGRVELEGAKVLEIGTGSGVLASTLKERVGTAGEVQAVDVVDQRLDRDAVQFTLVAGTSLPFVAESFDLVISNHVIEHVGPPSEQENHIREIARVLRPHGALYLATPNRWAPIEPHFNLPLLSWLPEGTRSRYVRLFRRGAAYDCRPLTRDELKELLGRQGFRATELSRDAIRLMREVETPSSSGRLVLRLAEALYPMARPILPTFILFARRR